MAKGKGGGRKKQGIVSWLTTFIALLLGFGPIWRILNGLFVSGDWNAAVDSLDRNYNPLRGDRAALAVGYGSLIGGIVFKIAAGELVKRAKMKSIIPALTA